MRLTDEDFNIAMMTFIKSKSNDLLVEVLTNTSLTKEKPTTIKNHYKQLKKFAPDLTKISDNYLLLNAIYQTQILQDEIL